MSEANSPVVVEDVVEEPSPPGAQADTPPRRAGPPVSPLPLVIALVALVVAIGLSVAGYFIWYQVQRLGSEQAGIETGVGDRIQPLRSSLESLDQTITRERDETGTRIDKLAEDQQSIEHRLSVLAALMGRSERGWTLAEVEYLLRIASQRLQLQRDTGTAAQALRAADDRLRDLADPHYQNVREQIARDLEAVAAVPAVDVDGLSATLGAALQQVDKLTVAGSHYTPAADAGPSGDTETAKTAAELAKVVWNSISELFRVREHDQPVGPMLAPEREYYLRENLRLQLAAARLALLRNDRAQYRSALHTAIEWLNQYFDRQTPAVKELLARLQASAEVDITPQLPDVSDSLHLLRQQMQLSEQKKLLPVVPANSTGDASPNADAGGEAGDKR
jgi:uroporphyrin-III C-methyltransferase